MPGLIVNARSLGRRVSGVERYARSLVERLPGSPRLAAPPRGWPALAGHAWEQLALPSLVRKGQGLWSPANSGPLRVSRQVLSLHDTFVLDHPEWYRSPFATWYRALLPLLVSRVRRVLTVSSWSRQQILVHFPSLSDRLSVVPAGVDLERFFPQPEALVARVRKRYGLPGDYVLFVGTLEPRKNLPRLLQAWQEVRLEFPRAVLAVAGDASPAFRWQQLPFGIGSVRFLGYVPGDDLPALYSGACLLALPSLAEGFGLPALEAMACGTPVLASAAGAIPETVGGAGLLFDPLDVQALAAALHHLLSDRNLREDLRHLGLVRAAAFSWEAAAARLSQELREGLE